MKVIESQHAYVAGGDNPGQGPYVANLGCILITKNPLTADGTGEYIVCFTLQYK